MEKSNEWVVGILLGLFFLVGAFSRGEGFTIGWLVRSFGKRGSRVIYAVLGVVLIVVSLRIRS